ncbi:MAG: glycoside hydrolase family 5 protein, partial [Sinobacteraceae bacterium]|nr:glycoside hydrolase family 5 protein [Nevskiaceae bacterium]
MRNTRRRLGIATTSLLLAALIGLVSIPLGSGSPDQPGAAAPTPDPAEPSATPAAVSAAAPSGVLSTDGGDIVDAQGRVVHITGVNWFGLETGTFAPHGLWTRGLDDMLDQIVQAGFNTIRLPFSDQLFDPSSVPNGIDFRRNPDLQGLSGLEIMDQVITRAGERGLKVILDRHRPDASAQSPLWYTERVSEQQWIDNWVMLASRYRDNPTVIGADLHNEPHGPATWGDDNPLTDWRAAAERAGNAVLQANPDWLIIVEGIEHQNNDWYWWGGNLALAGQLPVQLSVPNKLVYEAHDYGPGVSGQSWFQTPDFPFDLPNVWYSHWAYLKLTNTAPVLIGEFGGRSMGDDTEGVWQRSLINFLQVNGFDYTYWSWNPNSGDTGGLLEDDWTTLNESKLSQLQASQWSLLGVAEPAADR